MSGSWRSSSWMRSKTLVIGMTSAMVFATALFSGPNAEAAEMSQPGLIVFVRERPYSGIYTMAPTGEDLTRLTHGSDYHPQWSPDGTRIVFQRAPWRPFGASGRIYVVDADGSGLTRLTDENGYQPSWSPDGTRIVFVRVPAGERSEIYVMNADGSDQRRLTNDLEADWLPAWSPDGTRILYTHGRNRGTELYLMNPDGTDQTRLTYNVVRDHAGDWAPDGSRIVFKSLRYGSWDLFTIRPDGTDLTQITDAPTIEWAPAWSPDGSQIAYTIFNWRTGSEDIAVINLVDSVETRFVMRGSLELEPDWQPGPALTS